jgi:hypothetical protein
MWVSTEAKQQQQKKKKTKTKPMNSLKPKSKAIYEILSKSAQN